jgi:hypothetical protein
MEAAMRVMGAGLAFCFRGVNAFVLGKQHLLAGTATRDVQQMVRNTGGLHATSSLTPYLSLFNRSPRFEHSELDRELREKRSLARIRCVRGTIYIQPRDWIPAFLAATRRRNVRQTAELARRSGISDRRYAELSEEIVAVLAGTLMAAVSIRSALGLRREISSALYRMCDEGILLREHGEQGWKDRTVYYRLFREAFPGVELGPIGETEAMAAVVEQYLRCFGPASKVDIAWWTGFGKSEVDRAVTSLGPRLAQVALSESGRSGLLLQEDVENLVRTPLPDSLPISLLPLLDGYLMGYRERERYLRPEHRDFVFDRGGNATSTVLFNGAIIGVWDWEERPRPVVKVHYLERVNKGSRALVEEEARRIGRFLCGEDVEVVICETMAPLVTRSAGGFQSPLKEAGQRGGAGA